MSKRIKGITIEIDGNTSKLEDSLKKINESSRKVAQELRDINRLTKFNPGNAELLSQKQRKLADQVSNTKKKLDELREADKQAKRQLESGDLGQDQYDALQREIVETESKLENFQRQLAEVNNYKLNKLGESFQKVGTKIQEVGSKVTDLGKQLTLKLTAPLLGIAGGATKAATDFESAFAGVRKTVDATEEEFAALEKGIKDMSKALPSSASEISAVAEAAGQLGIQNENILTFSRSMIDLGQATNMTAEEAATQLARFANITQMSQQDFERLGSTIVDLGNNFATTESEIVDMSLRLAGTGSQVGMTETNILALSTAMSSLGIQSEAGGSAMSRVMQKINTAVLEGKDSLDSFAKVAGVSGEEFARVWQSKPAEALVMFIEGLNGVQEEGGNVVGVLSELGISGLREVDTLQRLSGNTDLLTEALSLSTTAWQDNTALSEEAAQRYETLDSKIEMAKNSVNLLAIELGEKLMPYVEKAAKKIAEFADGLADMDEETFNTIISVGKFLAVFGPVLVVVGKVISVFGGLVKGIGGVIKAFAAVKTALAAGSGAFVAVGGVIGALAAPIAVVVGAIATLMITNEEFREKVIAVWNRVKEVIGNVVGAIKDFVGGVATFFFEKWTVISETVGNAVNTIKDTVETKFNEIKDGVVTVFTNIATFFSETWDGIVSTVTTAWDNIKAAFEVAWLFIEEMFGLIVDIIMIPWNFIWENFGAPLTEAWESITSYLSEKFTAISDFFTETWTAITTFFSDTWEGIKSVASTAWEAIKETIITPIVNLYESIKTKLSEIGTAISTKWNEIKTTTGNVWEGIKSSVSDKINTVKETVSNVVESIRSFVSDKWNAIKETTTNIWNAIKDAIVSPISDAWDKVKEVVGNLVDGAKSKFEDFKTKVGEIWDGVKEAITAPIRKAKEVIDDIVDGFKSVFNFEWKLPKLKLPHLNITGGFSLIPPQVPKFSIDWYDKGGIFTGPQIIGVGEKRPEFVGALDDLKAIVADVIQKEGGDSSQVIHNNFNMENVTIRDDSDIHKIAEELYRLQAREGRRLKNA